MHVEQEPVIVRRDPEQAASDQGWGGEVEAMERLILDQPSGLGFPLVRVQAAQVRYRDGEDKLGSQMLYRPAFLERETGAQHLVPPNDVVQGTLQGPGMEGAPDT